MTVELLSYVVLLALQIITFVLLLLRRSSWSERLVYSLLVAFICSVSTPDGQFPELLLLGTFVYIFSKGLQAFFIISTLKQQNVRVFAQKSFRATIVTISLITVCVILFFIRAKNPDNPVWFIEHTCSFILVTPILEELQSRVIEFNIIQKKEKGSFLLWAIGVSVFYSFNHMGHVLDGSTSWIFSIIVLVLWLVLFCIRKKYSKDSHIHIFMWIHFFWNFGVIFLKY